MSRRCNYDFYAQEPRLEMPRQPTHNLKRPVAMMESLRALCINAASDTSSSVHCLR